MKRYYLHKINHQGPFQLKIQLLSILVVKMENKGPGPKQTMLISQN